MQIKFEKSTWSYVVCVSMHVWQNEFMVDHGNCGKLFQCLTHFVLGLEILVGVYLI